MTIERPNRVDYLLIGSTLALILIGLAMVYSATADDALTLTESLWFRQGIFFLLGGVIAAAIAFVPPKVFYVVAYPLYFLTLILLFILARQGGLESHGAMRWVSIGGINFQPSELAKLAYLLALARLLSNHQLSLYRLTSLILPGILFIIPFLLILKQPDLSTALVFVAITLAMFYWNGFCLKQLFILVSPIISIIAASNQIAWAVVIVMVFIVLMKLRIHLQFLILVLVLNLATGYASYMVWNGVLKDHQRSRILTFLDPTRDPRGEGYQVIQSRVAIGSGGVTGKGFGQGSQTNLSFLPEEHTDFIFSVLGEQFGLVGSAITLFFFYIFLMRIMTVCTIHRNRFLNLVVVGTVAIFFFHIVVNIAMTLGMMPVTGLPLPFLSYGGTFVITCMVLMGLILNMRAQGYKL
jgi:rod shape determining protein RodA